MLIGRRLNDYQTALVGRKLPGTITRGLGRFAPNFSPRVIAPKRGVIRKRKSVNKKEFIGVVVLICLLNFVLQIWYAGSAGDFIANYVGYPISVFIIPIFISQLLPCVTLSASSKPLAPKQKLLLFGVPCFVSVCLVFGFYLVIQYGG